jgi:capsular exopolysaccharide synthesis family protein
MPPSSPVNSQLLFRGLARNWWRILLVWVMLSAPLVYLIYKFVQPTYQAISLVRIEPNQPELFGPQLQARDAQPIFLQTQRTLITSNAVLERVTAEPSIRDLPIIKDSIDPEEELRKKLNVQITPSTHLITVALESTKAAEAADIVNAVMTAFENYNKDHTAGMDRVLIKDLEGYKSKLDDQIKETKDLLRDLAAKGNVSFPKPSLGTKSDDTEQSPQPFFYLSLDEYRSTKDRLMQVEFQLMEDEARYQARQADGQQTQATGDSAVTPSHERVNKQLRDQIVEEFQRDPAVVALTAEISATKEELAHAREVAKKDHDPARVAANRKLTRLNKEYDDLWWSKSEQIRQKLVVQTGAPGSAENESLVELKRRIDSRKGQRNSLKELLAKFDASKQKSETDTLNTVFLRDDLNRFYSWHDQVNRKLEQLKFARERADIHIEEKQPAKVPKEYFNNKQLKYMLLLPVGTLFAVLGLFLLLEVKSERVADPDQLSTRVHSEVFALPPMPTSRAIRKLSRPVVDDQIDRFIQRLDHLRFAVCGDHRDTELGRCVLITSSVEREGKTTLAAQLAARCGNAGISTLLIDADLRRANLCRLLDVPEGSGLTDVLTGEAKLEDVVIPVQEGTFYLLSAGTPVHDPSRILQERNLAMLIAQLRQRYEMIVIDSPPVLPVPDALILGRWTDGVLLATRYEVSRSPQVERARRQLGNAGIPVLGTVINGMRSFNSYYGRYTYSRQRPSQTDPSSSV